MREIVNKIYQGSSKHDEVTVGFAGQSILDNSGGSSSAYNCDSNVVSNCSGFQYYAKLNRLGLRCEYIRSFDSPITQKYLVLPAPFEALFGASRASLYRLAGRYIMPDRTTVYLYIWKK